MFAELDITSNFTFLCGASHPEEYVETAARLGLPAFAIADENSVAGLVRAHAGIRETRRKQETGEGEALNSIPRLVPAARLVTEDGFSAVALPRDRAAWGRLSRLLSIGRLRAEKGQCRIGFSDLLEWLDGMEILLHTPGRQGKPAGKGGEWAFQTRRLAERFSGAVSLAASPLYDGHDLIRFKKLDLLARRLDLPMAASAAPIMHVSGRARLADVLTAIRTGRRVDQLGRGALVNAERRLRSEAEMMRLFRGHETAVEHAGAIAERCRFSLDELRYEYPSEISGSETPQQRLARLASTGLAGRYSAGAPARVQEMLERELDLIGKLGYAPYFLTVKDIVDFARSRGILCQGRGSAANSVVCYLLGITSVSPDMVEMVFARFVSEARNEPPDIDVDFEHERREEVIQHIYEHYGRHRAGMCATVVHYRGKRAIREVGKAMGLSEDTVAALSSQIWGWGGGGVSDEWLREIGQDPANGRLKLTLAICDEIRGFPRHLSQHVGGFIITEGRLDELVPIENATMEDRTVICWDKDDIDALGILKVDVLSLGMLTCIRKSFDMIRAHHGKQFTIESLPAEDSAVYDMLCEADSVGVFQVESRAQMNFLPRMKPRCFYDLVIEVAIIRPGPIQGEMVHPFIRRRNGEEKPDCPEGPLCKVLEKTYGVPLFQEQAMQIAILGAGFSPDEADQLRRSLATFRRSGTIHLFRNRFIEGMLASGHEQDFSERCFSQIEGFAEYGFPESHAASFAKLVYVSAWLKRHHPGIFACALLNSQPMGFYAPAQIVRDAREHGVEIRPVCINASYWDNAMEPGDNSNLALRLGFRQVKTLGKEDANWIASARGNGYREVADVWRRAGVSQRALQSLAEADAFASLGITRRQALWDARAVKEMKPMPLFGEEVDAADPPESAIVLPGMSLGEHVIEDYASTKLTLRTHPVALIRHLLTPDIPPSAAPCHALKERIGIPMHPRPEGEGAFT